MRGLAAITSMPVRLLNMTYKRVYFENAALCFECTGRGCKHCNGSGIEDRREFMNRKGDLIYLSILYQQCVNELRK